MYNDYLQNYSSEVFWVGVNLLTVKSWLYFGENYYPVYRRLLDEHEGMDPTDYPLSLVLINITQIILEWFFGNESKFIIELGLEYHNNFLNDHLPSTFGI